MDMSSEKAKVEQLSPSTVQPDQNDAETLHLFQVSSSLSRHHFWYLEENVLVLCVVTWSPVSSYHISVISAPF